MRQIRKSSLFLIELIIAILFFSLSAAICVRLFAAAHTTSQRSAHRDAAMLQAQSMAALFQSADGALDEVLAFANATETEQGTGVYQGTITQNGVAYGVTLTTAVTGDVMPGQCIALTIEIAADASIATDATTHTKADPLVTLETTVYLPLQIGEVRT